MKKLFFCITAILCIMLLSSCAGIGGKAEQVSSKNDELVEIIEKSIAEHEEDGKEVVETIVSSDGLLALLVDSETYENDYLQLFVYDKSGDCFVPMFEPQVRSEEVSAAEGGGFTVECDSGTYFVGKNENGQWNIHGNGTPFGAGPQ